MEQATASDALPPIAGREEPHQRGSGIESSGPSLMGHFSVARG